MMKDGKTIPIMAEIAEVRSLSGDTSLFRLRFEEEENFHFLPGQFVQLSVPSGGEVPISIAGGPSDDRSLELCARRVGHVTTMLHSMGRGEKVGVRGPFGNGFPVGEMKGKDILLLAGGLGIAPLRSLLHYILAYREDYAAVTLMYGSREPDAILFREELAELSCRRDMRLLLTVDFLTDGPPGELACNVGLLPSLLKGFDLRPADTTAAVCGPPALYRCLTSELEALGIPDRSILLSLERRMKCGVGLCSHCAVGDLFCCTDGPVFRFSDIRGIEGAL
ncbi:MAG: FAD/NAD(P)-binding protein [Geobacter sp.]|nr:FAD/NAD(P)-binding protein [Geobacter sp.]